MNARHAPRPRCIPLALTLAFALIAGAGSLSAVTTVLWVQDSAAAFEKGKPDGVAVSSQGEILLARTVREVQIKALEEDAQPFLWSEVMDSKGNLFIGSGNEGRVFKVPRGGAGSLFYVSGDLSVQALAVDSEDRLFVGTAPEGKVYRLTPEGKSEVWFEPEERYIWALAVDRSGDLYVATGEHGVVYKVTARAKAVPFFDSEESHIVALAFDRQGNLFAGSSGKGLLYRISPDGKATVVLDTALKEVNSLALDPSGRVYASAIQGESPAATRTLKGARPRGPGVREDVVSSVAPGGGPTLSETVGEEAEVTAEQAPPLGPDGRAVRSQVYRIEPDGISLPIWSSETETVFAVAVAGEREVFLGTGDLGKVRRIEPDGTSSLVARLSSSQVTSLLAASDGSFYAAASNAGRIYLLEKEVADTGVFLSPPEDARTIARWGRISWIGDTPPGTKIEIFTRSGNSTVPDSTWSEWSPGYVSREGSAVASPPARFIQWRARLSRQTKGVTPRLESVSLAYLPANLPPEVRKVEVHPPGVVILTPPAAIEPNAVETALSRVSPPPEGTEIASPFPPPEGKMFFQKGMRSLSWEATDPNSDALRYDLFFRGEGEENWKPLARGMTEKYFAWDSSLMPDGRYRIKVLAADAPSNLPGSEKKGERTSAPFLVDNTPPRVEASQKKDDKGAGMEVRATDSTTPIRSLEYSLDSAPWTQAAPADGISDSLSEHYRIPLERLPAGEHSLLLKATDTEGNVGTAMVRMSGG